MENFGIAFHGSKYRKKREHKITHHGSNDFEAVAARVFREKTDFGLLSELAPLDK